VPRETPRGTPVRFELHMDKHSLITVSGEIGEHAFRAVVELPAERALPDDAELTALQTAFEEGIEFLPAGPRSTTTLQWTLAKESHQAATELGDEAQAIHDFEEMERIVGGLGSASGELVPPKAEFDQLVKDCTELNALVKASSGQYGIVHDSQEMALSVAGQQEEGERAFQAGDQRAYSEAILQLEAFATYLSGIAGRILQAEDPLTDEERATGRIRIGLEEAAAVQDMARAKGRSDLESQARVLEQQLIALRPVIGRSPGQALVEASQHRVALQRLRNILMGQSDDGSVLVVDDSVERRR
jgi:molecular chaperone DnaK